MNVGNRSNRPLSPTSVKYFSALDEANRRVAPEVDLKDPPLLLEVCCVGEKAAGVDVDLPVEKGNLLPTLVELAETVPSDPSPHHPCFALGTRLALFGIAAAMVLAGRRNLHGATLLVDFRTTMPWVPASSSSSPTMTSPTLPIKGHSIVSVTSPNSSSATIDSLARDPQLLDSKIQEETESKSKARDASLAMMVLKSWNASPNSLHGTTPSELRQQGNHLGTIPSDLGLLTTAGRPLSLSMEHATTGEMGNGTGSMILVLPVNELLGTKPSESRQSLVPGHLARVSRALHGSIPQELAVYRYSVLSGSSAKVHGSIPLDIGLVNGVNRCHLDETSTGNKIPNELGLSSGLSLSGWGPLPPEGSLPLQSSQLNMAILARLDLRASFAARSPNPSVLTRLESAKTASAAIRREPDGFRGSSNVDVR